MIKRKLGNSGLEIAPLAFGGNVLGWTADERNSFAVLDAFLAAGLNFIDTADVYSIWIPGHVGGESETMLGKWMTSRRNRDKVLIATKCGAPMGEGQEGLSPAYIRAALDKSLQRLQTDYIDLYQAHKDDEKTPMEDTLGTFAELMKSGKVRAIGCSNFSAPRLAEALRVSAKLGLPRYESCQPWYNLYDRAMFEGDLASLCHEENIAVISYFSLASGFLTGKYRSEKDIEGRPRGYRIKDMLNVRGYRILAALDEIARRLNATPAQVSLAWLLAHGVTAPIASATNVTQMNELVGAVNLKLDAATVAALDEASEGSTVDAPRAPPPRPRSS